MVKKKEDKDEIQKPEKISTTYMDTVMSHKIIFMIM